MDLVSVVVPVYNVEKYIRECVESILRQTWPNLEVILVDDGSPDQCPKICDEFAEIDSRIKVIHQRNGGLSSARNAGMAMATGKYLYFIDSDDYIADDAIELLVQHIERENADMVFFNRDIFYSDYTPKHLNIRYRSGDYPTRRGREQLLELFRSNDYLACVPYLFFRKEYLQNNNISFKEGVLHEDELFTFLAFEANGIVAYLDEILYYLRKRPNSIMTSGNSSRNFDSMVSIYYEAARLYDIGRISGDAADVGMARFVRMALFSKYKFLNEEERNARRRVVRKLKHDVMRHQGYNDIKLKIKCSGFIMNKFYRFKYKILNK